MLIFASLACRPSDDTLTLHVPAEHEAVFRQYAEFTGFPGLTIEVGGRKGPGQDVILELASPSEEREAGWYRIDADKVVTITGGSVLGLQYGLSALLEEQGFRFVHPQHAIVPQTLTDLSETTLAGGEVTPKTPINGLQLHTLHPIESLYDLWLPGDDSLLRSKQLVDWLVKNRGNHLQWPALDDIWKDASAAARWQEHTAAIVEEAHARGVTVGIGVQLFGSGNLQRAFDLVDVGGYSQEEVDARLAVIAPTQADIIVLTFGEFSGEDPETFVDIGNQAIARMKAAMSGVEVTTAIHVGNYEDLRIEYQGEEMLYYFLAQYMDATPLIHTVMYYNLFDDAGGAYLHDEFDEHRAFLLDGLAAGENIGYFPESAYWIAFDISVPQYLPVYLRSRSTDLVRIRDEGGPLPKHVLFSSGWEWGYWQTDLLTLRMVDGASEEWQEGVQWLWSPWGEDGSQIADAVIALGELQHQALIVGRLAPYLAGREAIIDLGDSIGILSQPDRPQFSEIASMTDEQRASLDTIVSDLEALSAGSRAILETLEGTSTHFLSEVRDGIEIDTLRAAFSAASYRTTLAVARGQDGSSGLVEMQTLLDSARAVVARRHGDLHWGGGDRIVSQSDSNPTIYQFGYLAKADSLCFWERERVQVQNLATGSSESVPPCT